MTLRNLIVIFALPLLWSPCNSLAAYRPPNVVLIVTDDQGWGDFGFHGNPHLKTPHLDRLASESVELTRFHVCPVCTTTRASLMTGRYNYRTGAIDTYLGRSTMVAEETTLAEMLSAAGYRTGIFGKWHLGDNYPSRAMDQGFSESLVHRGGGVGQPADPPGSDYFDPILMRNGKEVTTQGYCSDVFTDAAIRFISEHRGEPTFTYLAFNCPHTPLQVPAEYFDRYRNLPINEATAKLYGMVANIDDNLGRLLAKLKELGLEDDTIVVFLNDNGPQTARYNGVLRGLKGSVHDGGIRTPCLIRSPGELKAGSKESSVTAHIDLVPTLLEATGTRLPKGVALDGISLWPLLQRVRAPLPDRLLFFQWHRGDVPEKYRACAIRGPRYKLVQAAGRDGESPLQEAWELFDMDADPGEQKNLLNDQPEIAAQMKAAYDTWFADVSSTRGYPVPRIIAGTTHENPVTLTRQDWRGPEASWNAGGLGYWDVEIAERATYDVTVRIPAAKTDRAVRLKIGDAEWSATLPADADHVTMNALSLPKGTQRVEATVQTPEQWIGAHYVDLTAKAPRSTP